MRDIKLEQLLEAWEAFGQVEKEVLHAYTMRLYAGQKSFGKLTYTKREWNYEALEEQIDYSVYMTAELVRMLNAPKEHDEKRSGDSGLRKSGRRMHTKKPGVG